MSFLIKKYLFSFIFLFNFLIANIQNNENKSIVILVSFDGFRYDYTNLIDTPNFDYIGNNGTKSISLQPIFPSFTFPNHYTIATGCYADNHGILGNTFYDYSKNKEYSYTNPKAVRDGSWYGCEPIWVTAEKEGLVSATYFWVGSEAKINNFYPTYYKNYKNGINPIDKIKQVTDWLSYPENKRPRLITLYFNEPDYSGHVYGPIHSKTIAQIEYADSLLGYLINSINKLDIADQVNFIIVSDHGMVEVSDSRVINLDDYLDFEYDYYGKGPYIEINGFSNNVNHRLPEIPNVTIYSRENFPDRFHFKTENLGEYLLLADSGWLLYTNDQIKEGELTVKGMHGYDPYYINMHGIFYAYGPKFKKGLIINTFESIHIYPLICEILNIKSNDDIDGNIDVLKAILK